MNLDRAHLWGIRMVSRGLACLAAISVAGGAASSMAQSNEAPIPMDYPSWPMDHRPPAVSRPSEAADPDQILGIRIESNGALITGALNERRVYLPLDRPLLPEGFQGLWAGTPELCNTVRRGTRNPEIPNGVIQIGPNEIVGRQRLSILKTFVPLPSSFTMEMLNSGRNLTLSASPYRDATNVLLIVSEPDGVRDYIEFVLLKDDSLVIQSRHSHETALRCREV